MTSAFRSMGCEIVVGGARAGELEAIARLFAERDRMFSRFRPDSELDHVNTAAGAPVRVSEEFARTVRAALAAAAWTRGLVDPTVGAAMASIGYTHDYADLWPDPRPARASVAQRWRSIGLSGRLLTVPRGVVLDLNGVVKSLAVDDALTLLGGPGFVSAGGDLATNASVAVSLPGGGDVTVRRGGLATSGTRRRWMRGGEVQHHLVDPRTGLPSRSPWFEVTVAASSCLRADVAAKAAFLLGENGPDWLDARGLPGRFVGTDTVHDECWRRSLGVKAAA